MVRRAAIILAVVLGLPVLALGAAILALPHVDLATIVAGRAAAALGRPVAIDSLRIAPGLRIGIEVRGARLGNIDGGTRDDMARLAQLSAEVELLPLLRGAVVVPSAVVDGFSLYLERGPERRANWHFSPHPPSGAPAVAVTAPTDPASDPVVLPGDRAGLPTILDLRLARSEVIYRTSSGNLLRTLLDSAAISAPGTSQPIILRAAGTYNDVPVTMEGTLGSFAALQESAAPFAVDVRMATGDTSLTFAGTAIDPVGVDGLEGKVAMRAGSLDALLAIAGAGVRHPAAIDLAADFVHRGNIWRATGGQGRLNGEAFTAALLQLSEDSGGRPDHVAVDMAFTRLDMNRLLGPPPAAGETEHGDADLRLLVAERPDPHVRAHLAVHELVYAKLRASDMQLKAAVGPGKVAVEDLALTILGARLNATAGLTATEKGARVVADVTLHDADVDTLRRALGMRPLPVAGKLHGRLAVLAEGHRLNEATHGAHVSAVVSMRGGSIAREVIEMASTDVRALFRSAHGVTGVSCLLGVVDMRAGRGQAVPLRIRAATGTIIGEASFDINHGWMDLVIGSQSQTTHALALDIPMRVKGSFANPDIAPAQWSRQGRARLAAADNIAPLPPPLRAFAEENPCLWRGGGRH